MTRIIHVTSTRLSVRVAVSVGALLAAGALVAPAASAHPELLDSTPGAGAVVGTSPAHIDFRFDEAGVLNGPGGILLDRTGTHLGVSASMSKAGTHGRLTPEHALPAGPYEAVIQIQAVDDHHIVQYPVAFCVKACPGAGPTVSTTADSGARVTIDGTQPGQHAVRIETPARSGTVSLMSDTSPAPMIWRLKGDGTHATARVILPYAAAWTAVFDLGHGRSAIATLQ